MKHATFQYEPEGSDSFNFPIDASIEFEVDGPGYTTAPFTANKLFGLMPGTVFRVWEGAEAPIIQVLGAGRDLTDMERRLLRPTIPNGVPIGFTRSEDYSAFSDITGSWRVALTNGVPDFERMVLTFGEMDGFVLVGDGDNSDEITY